MGNTQKLKASPRNGGNRDAPRSTRITHKYRAHRQLYQSGAFAHSAKWLSNANDAARGDSGAHYVNDELDSLVRRRCKSKRRNKRTRLGTMIAKRRKSSLYHERVLT